MKLPSNVKTFSGLCDFIKTVHETKNGDYGSTWLFVQDMIGVDTTTTIWSRCLDKVLRVSNLLKRRNQTGGGPLVEDESIMDSLLDLAVYCLIGVSDAIRLADIAENAEFECGHGGDCQCNCVEFDADFEVAPDKELQAAALGQEVPGFDNLLGFIEQVLGLPGSTVYGPASFVKTLLHEPSRNPFAHSKPFGGAFSEIDFEKIKEHCVRYGDTMADKISEEEGC